MARDIGSRRPYGFCVVVAGGDFSWGLRRSIRDCDRLNAAVRPGRQPYSAAKDRGTVAAGSNCRLLNGTEFRIAPSLAETMKFSEASITALILSLRVFFVVRLSPSIPCFIVFSDPVRLRNARIVGSDS